MIESTRLTVAGGGDIVGDRFFDNLPGGHKTLGDKIMNKQMGFMLIGLFWLLVALTINSEEASAKKVAFQANDGQGNFVRADGGEGGCLRDDRWWVQEHEIFDLEEIDTNSSGDSQINLRTYHNLFVTEDISKFPYPITLRVKPDNTYGLFNVEPQNWGGRLVALRTQSAHCIGAPGGGGPLHAKVKEISGRNRFQLFDVYQAPPAVKGAIAGSAEAIIDQKINGQDKWFCRGCPLWSITMRVTPQNPDLDIWELNGLYGKDLLLSLQMRCWTKFNGHVDVQAMACQVGSSFDGEFEITVRAVVRLYVILFNVIGFDVSSINLSLEVTQLDCSNFAVDLAKVLDIVDVKKEINNMLESDVGKWEDEIKASIEQGVHQDDLLQVHGQTFLPNFDPLEPIFPPHPDHPSPPFPQPIPIPNRSNCSDNLILDLCNCFRPWCAR